MEHPINTHRTCDEPYATLDFNGLTHLTAGVRRFWSKKNLTYRLELAGHCTLMQSCARSADGLKYWTV